MRYEIIRPISILILAVIALLPTGSPAAQGGFDSRGFRIIHDPTGEPLFVPGNKANGLLPSDSCNDRWHDGLPVNGVDGAVYAIAVDGAGNVYVAGRFSVSGSVVTNNIAKWDGSNWSALGSGIDITMGYIPAIAISGTDVYVGVFTYGSGDRSYVSKWNGNRWTILGGEMDGKLTSVAVTGTTVYTGVSRFNGNSYHGHLSKWNGIGLETLGGEFDDWIHTIAVSGGDVYVGGDFSTAGGAAARAVARWNGTTWSALGSGINGSVRAIAISGSDVYAGGDFTTAGGAAASRLAKWNGTSWSPLGSGTNDSVNAIAVSGTDVYVGGNFRTAGGAAAKGIAKWNGSGWSPVGSGNGYVIAIAVSGTDVYTGGYFDQLPARGVVKWNGFRWSSLGSGVVSLPSRFAVSGADLYAAGYFTADDGVTVSPAAKWNGASWTPFPALPSEPGISMEVSAIALSGTDIYVGGTWSTQAAETRGGYVYKWNGTTWIALGSGMSGGLISWLPVVRALAISGTNVYAGGDFTKADGLPANRIAKWNGSTWSALGGGLNGGYPPIVFDIVVSGGDVYAAGGFTSAGGSPANYVAKWNGTAWSALGTGPVNTSSSPNRPADTFDGVTDIEVTGQSVYAAGGINGDYGEGSGYVAIWDGTAWTRSPFTYSNPLYAMAVSGTHVYAGGDNVFGWAGNTPVNHIAEWNGSSWSALGTGMGGFNPWVNAIVVLGKDVFVGGTFTTAGCHVSANFARYSLPTAAVSGRVTTPDGRGLRNASVSITDANGIKRTVTTSSFGFYQFDDVLTGRTYTVRVSSRLYRYSPRDVPVDAELTNVDFVGLE